MDKQSQNSEKLRVETEERSLAVQVRQSLDGEKAEQQGGRLLRCSSQLHKMTFPWLQGCDPGWALGYPLFMLR